MAAIVCSISATQHGANSLNMARAKLMVQKKYTIDEEIVSQPVVKFFRTRRSGRVWIQAVGAVLGG